MDRRRGARILTTLAVTLVLADCGSSPAPTQRATSHLLLDAASAVRGLALTVGADEDALPALRAAITNVHHLVATLRVHVTTVALPSLPTLLLSTPPPLVVTSVAPSPTIVQQADVTSWPYAPAELTVTVNLGSTSGLVLSTAVLRDLMTGRISVWDAAPIAHLNPSRALPPIPVSVAPLARGGARAVWLAQSLGIVPSDFHARTTSTCAQTVGCMQFLINATAPNAVSILDPTATARLPQEAAYPLRTSATALVTPAPLDPRRAIAALLVARELVSEGTEPPPERTDELQRLDRELAGLEASLP